MIIRYAINEPGIPQLKKPITFSNARQPNTHRIHAFSNAPESIPSLDEEEQTRNPRHIHNQTRWVSSLPRSKHDSDLAPQVGLPQELPDGSLHKSFVHRLINERLS